MTDPTTRSDAHVRLATIREICRREGHASLIDVSSPRNGMIRLHLCSRGCDAQLYRMPYGWTATGDQIRAFLDAHPGVKVTVTEFEAEVRPTEDAKGEEA